jgi:superfamily I DNA and RNA helicase
MRIYTHAPINRVQTSIQSQSNCVTQGHANQFYELCSFIAQQPTRKWYRFQVLQSRFYISLKPKPPLFKEAEGKPT